MTVQIKSKEELAQKLENQGTLQTLLELTSEFKSAYGVFNKIAGGVTAGTPQYAQKQVAMTNSIDNLVAGALQIKENRYPKKMDVWLRVLLAMHRCHAQVNGNFVLHYEETDTELIVHTRSNLPYYFAKDTTIPIPLSTSIEVPNSRNGQNELLSFNYNRPIQVRDIIDDGEPNDAKRIQRTG